MGLRPLQLSNFCPQNRLSTLCNFSYNVALSLFVELWRQNQIRRLYLPLAVHKAAVGAAAATEVAQKGRGDHHHHHQ